MVHAVLEAHAAWQGCIARTEKDPQYVAAATDAANKRLAFVKIRHQSHDRRDVRAAEIEMGLAAARVKNLIMEAAQHDQAYQERVKALRVAEAAYDDWRQQHRATHNQTGIVEWSSSSDYIAHEWGECSFALEEGKIVAWVRRPGPTAASPSSTRPIFPDEEASTPWPRDVLVCWFCYGSVTRAVRAIVADPASQTHHDHAGQQEAPNEKRG